MRWPENLTNLELNFPQGNNLQEKSRFIDLEKIVWPEKLTNLDVNCSGRWFDWGKMKWPKKLTNLRINLAYDNNSYITYLNQIYWPDNLINLQLYNGNIYFKEKVNWPKNLKYLGLGGIIDLEKINWPDQLEQLKLDFTETQITDLSNLKLPQGLKEIDITYKTLYHLPKLPSSVNTIRLTKE